VHLIKAKKCGTVLHRRDEVRAKRRRKGDIGKVNKDRLGFNSTHQAGSSLRNFYNSRKASSLYMRNTWGEANAVIFDIEILLFCGKFGTSDRLNPLAQRKLTRVPITTDPTNSLFTYVSPTIFSGAVLQPPKER
jgi:hypothetical protein